MTAEQINEVLKQRDPEWIRSSWNWQNSMKGLHLNTEKRRWNC